MKRQERHHLKENELAHIARNARDVVEQRRSQLLVIVIALVVVAVSALGYFGYRSRAENRAGALLADAQIVEEARVGPPPLPGTPAAGLSFPTDREKLQAALTKYKQVADEYPSTDAGQFARYREATLQVALGNPKEATAAYQQVIDVSGDALYGRMARLGLAEAHVRSGNFDQAITTYQELAQQKDGPLPVDGILMQLGRTYLEAGKPAEAQQTFNRIVEEFPQSPFSGEAQRELEGLKKT
jgi:tetratricopeptide (TPR) repeat protein